MPAEVASYAVVGARLRGRPGRWRIDVRDGLVTGIGPDTAETGPSDPIDIFDVGGQLVLPGFVDLHVHLDKAYQLRHLDRSGEDFSGIAGALRATAALRDVIPLAEVERNGRRVLATMASGGTVAARVHVEVSPTSDPAAVRMHRDLAAGHPDMALELTAFAQHGTTSDRAVLARMEAALGEGCTVVGGCPYADVDPLGHLDQMIALAVESGAPLDLHLDLSDDVRDLLLGEVVPRVERAGLQGRVVVGHVTALTAAAPEQVRELAVAVAGAGIAVVSIPSTDLYLSGRAADRAPTRGVTRIAELAAAGVAVSVASNNYENAFTPVTMPSLSQAAWLASLTNYLATEAQQLHLLDAITSTPRASLWIAAPGLDVGRPVGAVALPVAEPVEVIRRAARPTWVLTASGALRPEAGVLAT